MCSTALRVIVSVLIGRRVKVGCQPFGQRATRQKQLTRAGEAVMEKSIISRLCAPGNRKREMYKEHTGG